MLDTLADCITTDDSHQSHLRAKHPRQLLHDFFTPRPALPITKRDLTRGLFVPLEHARLFGRKPIVYSIKVGFVVEPERTIIEISRPDRYPTVVNHHHLAVIHGGLVLIDCSTSREQ